MAGIKQIGNKANVKTTAKKKKQVRRPRARNQDRWFLKYIEDNLKFTKTSTRSGVFYPSMLGNPCDRNLYLAYTGQLPEQVIEAKTVRIFDAGSSLEVRMKKYFERLGIFLADEQSVKFANPAISGRYDFLLRHEEHGRIILELKSINDTGFNDLIEGPKSDHFIQLQTYLNLAEVEHGIVLYENKNDQRLKAFKVVRDTKLWESILERCIRIQNMLPMDMPLQCKGDFFCSCRRVK
tara:strand:+ start:2555 stop:3265 length:711 start_codon:yes stop_codon:yes gene_type:complete